MTVVTELTAAGERHEVSAKEKSYRSKLRRRRIIIHLCQVGFLVVILGGWQLYVGNDSRKIILYGVPSGIVGRLHTWIVEGTATAPGRPDLVTLEEALIGFLIGTALASSPGSRSDGSASSRMCSAPTSRS